MSILLHSVLKCSLIPDLDSDLVSQLWSYTSLIPRPSHRLVLIACNTTSDQKLDGGKAWERG